MWYNESIMTKQQAKYTATDIANWFIDKANSLKIDDSTTEGITNLKLQKIVYLAQAASLATENKSLFDDEIQAWQYGPVIPAVYDKYKKYTNKIIPKSKVSQYADIDADTKELLLSIWDLFGGLSAYQLVNITHNHLPWKTAFDNGNGNHSTIGQSSIKDFYKNIFTKK